MELADYDSMASLSSVDSESDSEILDMEFPSDDGEELDMEFPSDGEEPEYQQAETSRRRASTATAPTRHLELAVISALLISACCLNNCMLTLCANDVLKTRAHFNSMSILERRKWMMDRLMNDSEIVGGKIKTKFIIAGKEVCKAAWCKVLPISEKTVSSLLGQITSGQVSS